MGILDKAEELLSQNADTVDTAITKAGEFVDAVGNVGDAARKVLDEADTGAQQG